MPKNGDYEILQIPPVFIRGFGIGKASQITADGVTESHGLMFESTDGQRCALMLTYDQLLLLATDITEYLKEEDAPPE